MTKWILAGLIVLAPSYAAVAIVDIRDVGTQVDFMCQGICAQSSDSVNCEPACSMFLLKLDRNVEKSICQER